MATEVEVPKTMHIESGPEGEAPEIEVTETPDPRKDVMTEIYANRNRMIEKEFSLAAKLEKGEEEPVEPEEPEVKPVEEPVVEPETPAVEPEPIQQKKYTLNLNGRQVEMTEEETVRAAQRVLSADERFEQASQMRREAQMVQAQPVAPAQVSRPAQPQQFDPMQIIDDQTASDLVRKINFGSEDEQRGAIRELGATIASGMGRANQGPTPEQVVEVATQRALATIAFQNNMSAIATEYKDVFESRPLSIAAADTVGQLRLEYAAKGIQKPDLELYREACKSIRDQFIRKPEAQPAEEPAPTIQAVQSIPMTEKLERKRVAPQPPAAASKIATEQPKQKGYNPSSIVQQMRKSRGQSAF